MWGGGWFGRPAARGFRPPQPDPHFYPFLTRNDSPMSQKQRKKDLACLLLAQGNSVTDVSRQVGVSPRTLHRWLERPEFKRRIDECQNELFATAVSRLTNLCGMAVEVLEELLKTGPATAKVRAAALVLENVCRLREVNEFAERLALIEEKLNASKNQKAAGVPGIPGNDPNQRRIFPAIAHKLGDEASGS